MCPQWPSNPDLTSHDHGGGGVSCINLGIISHPVQVSQQISPQLAECITALFNNGSY